MNEETKRMGGGWGQTGEETLLHFSSIKSASRQWSDRVIRPENGERNKKRSEFEEQREWRKKKLKSVSGKKKVQWIFGDTGASG